MAGYCSLLLALLSPIGLISYWISWDVQHKATRPAFSAKLWNDILRLIGRESGGATTAPAKQSIASQPDDSYRKPA